MLDLEAAGFSQVHALSAGCAAAGCPRPGAGLSQSGSGALTVLHDLVRVLELSGPSESDMGVTGTARRAERRTPRANLLCH